MLLTADQQLRGLCSINANDGTFAFIGSFGLPSGTSIYGLAYDYERDRLWGVSDGGEESLFEIDRKTGAATRVGPLGMTIKGMVYDRATGTIYGTSRSEVDNVVSLCVIDPITGAASIAGVFSPQPFSMTGLSFNPFSGDLYGSDNIGFKLYRIGLETASIEYVGPVQWALFRDIAFHPDTGRLYALQNGENVWPSKLYEYDFGTQAPIEIGFTGLSFPSGLVFTPEPSSLLIWIGLCWLGGSRRARARGSMSAGRASP